MSFITPSPQDCCRPCPEVTTTDIPGPQGPAGAAGTNGTNGRDAFTTTTAQFTMPAEGAYVTVDVLVSAWAVVGQYVCVGLFGSASFGTFKVAQVADATHLVLYNVAVAASGLYADNSIPGTVFPASSSVGPGGEQGPAGAAGVSGAPANATYLTQTPNGLLPNSQAMSGLATGLVTNNTGTGVQFITPLGINASNVAPVDAGGALTAGKVVSAAASGLKTDTDANTRASMGLGTMATQNASAVNITGGTITGVTLPAPAGTVTSWAVFQYQATTGTPGDAFPNGAWATVPLNTELLDPDGIGTIALNIVTLIAGTYRFRWNVSGSACDAFTTRLVSGVATVLAYGSSAKASSTDTTQDESFGWWRATVGAGTQVRLEAQAGSGGGTYGNANGFGQPECYATLEIEKEAP